MFSFLKHLIPKPLRNLYHFILGWCGALRYRHPSDELLVIGVTGTSGKSSTVYLLRQVLERAGWKVGALSTIDFHIAGKNKLNDRKMTMLGRLAIQRYLREMVHAGCQVAIVETTSEGIVQYRHRFINYDTVALTNLYPEHIESHGSFDKYKEAKKKLFAHAARAPRKTLFGKIAPKTAIVNGNSEFAREFLSFPFDKKILFGREDIRFAPHSDQETCVHASDSGVGEHGIHFVVGDHVLSSRLYGEHNIMNLLLVVSIAESLGLSWDHIQSGVESLRGVPGRIEFIPEADAHGFQVIVDYAFEPVAMSELYKVVNMIKPKRIIHVLGATGGGRDASRRKILGEFVGERAALVIATNEDPYDDDPERIIEAVAGAAEAKGKKEGETLYRIPDRKQAIEKALSLAEAGDLVLVTGKGSEQGIVEKGRIIPWDDRAVVRTILQGYAAS